MLLRLFLLFTIVPVLELAFLVHLGGLIGPWWTIGIVLSTGFAGAWLAKREGFAILRQLQADLQQGIPPTHRLMEGALVLIGSVLLITPGVFTDVTGMVLLLPFTRRRIAPVVLRYLVHRFTINVTQRRTVSEGWVDPEPNRPKPLREGRDSHFDHPVR